MRKTMLAAVLLPLLGLAGPPGSRAAADVTVDWRHYHNYRELTSILKELAERHPHLAKLSSIGKSFQGKDLWCMELTNAATGAAETKPAMYIDGNTHAGEVSGAEVCLYIIHFLLTRYGEDEEVRRLLDTQAFYIVPKVNPDGSDAYLRKPGEPPEQGLRPVDDDGDGRLDEDGSEDLNGDGVISLMRARDPQGPLKTSRQDPRLMVERKPDENGEWRMVGPEGLDNDEDGRINEDPPGAARTVSNRNYPAYWAPEWIQAGAGKYPLSEPEARAQVDFILSHPNIGAIQSYHTHSGVLLRPYCNRGDEHIPAEDMRYYEVIGALGKEITGYPLVSVYNEFTTDKAHPRHGVFVDWAYDHFGASAFTTEIWKAPGETGESVFEGRDDHLAMQFNDRELAGKAFVDWKDFNHPQFGPIQIGGWRTQFFIQNPPPKLAEAEWEKNCRFELKRAQLLPHLKISDVRLASLGDRLVKVSAVVENEGFLPTNVTAKAIEHHTAKPVKVKLELEAAELLGGEHDTDIGHIPGNAPRPEDRRGDVQGRDNVRVVEWLIRLTSSRATAKLTVSSPKAGTVTTTFRLGEER